jgi:hypothetical protein
MEKKQLEMRSAAYEIQLSLESTFNYAESLLNYINRQIASNHTKNVEIAKILSSFNESNEGLNSIKDMLVAGMFHWINDKDQFVASSSGVLTVPVDLSNRDYLAKTKIDPWKIFLGSPVIGATSGQYIIPAAVGVIDKENHYIGTSVASFKIHDLVEKFKRVIAEDEAGFAILDANDKVVMESEPELFSKNRELVKELKIISSYSNEKFSSQFCLSKKDEHYVTLIKSEKYPYKILVGNDIGKIRKEAFFEVLPHLIEFLILTGFFVVFRVSYSRRS